MNYLKRLYLAIFISIHTLAVYGQSYSWVESGAPKGYKIIVPASLTISLPTTDNYKIGYFIYDSGSSSLKNVGQGDYTPGSDITIELGSDPTGSSGYKTGDRFITLIQNTSNAKTYGIEFEYKDDKKYFNLNDSSYVSQVITDTWRDFFNQRFYFCKSEFPLALHIPFGLKPTIMYTTDIVVDSAAGYPVLIFSKMAPTAGTIQIFGNGITYIHTLYSFFLTDFPAGKLNKSYSICPGEAITIPDFKDSLRRTPVSNGSYNLITAGDYVYDLIYEPYGCRTRDTINITASIGPCKKIDYPEVINPEYGIGIVFPETEKITILNAGLEKVLQLNTPFVWNGTGNNGQLLPVGVYYIVHENGDTHSITIIY